jgi:hypothetical protein
VSGAGSETATAVVVVDDHHVGPHAAEDQAPVVDVDRLQAGRQVDDLDAPRLRCVRCGAGWGRVGGRGQGSGDQGRGGRPPPLVA